MNGSNKVESEINRRQAASKSINVESRPNEKGAQLATRSHRAGNYRYPSYNIMMKNPVSNRWTFNELCGAIRMRKTTPHRCY
jgi:hypothetical protein